MNIQCARNMSCSHHSAIRNFNHSLSCWKKSTSVGSPNGISIILFGRSSIYQLYIWTCFVYGKCYFIGCSQPTRPGSGYKSGSDRLLQGSTNISSLRKPLCPSTVEDCNLIMSIIAQCPPQSGSA